MTTNKTLVCVVGPTAVGKTATAIELANYCNAEIISADSRQFYKEISIGTAKPTREELSQAKHHFVDFLPLDSDYSSGKFEREALQFLKNYFEQKDICICAGGSGLYVNALLYGFDDLPSSDEERKSIQGKMEREGFAALQQELKSLDPDHFASMDISNTQRVMRAIEVCRVSGKKYSELRTISKKKRPFNIIILGLNREREELYNRINHRVDLMLQDGLLDEVKSVHDRKHLNSLQTVGYREFFSYLDGEHDLEEAIRLVKRNTRRFAKRQLTWFNRYEGIEWFTPDDLSSIKDRLKNHLDLD